MNAVQPIDLALLCVAGLLTLWGLRYLGMILFISLKVAFVGALVVGLVQSTTIGRNALTGLVESSSTLSPIVKNGAELYIAARAIGTRLLAAEQVGSMVDTPSIDRPTVQKSNTTPL